jgi:hypothetical protein
MSVSNSHYVGTPFNLKLPTIDTVSQVLTLVGNNVKIFKVDLARAFRQLNLDPFDVKYMGLYWKDQLYVDTAVPFGYRHGTLCVQRVTDLIQHILFKHNGVLVLNYIDDIIDIAPDSVADVHFKITINLLNSLGFILSNSKTISPSKIPTCLGININISLGTMHIPLAKLQDVITLCQKYLNLKFITKNRLQALIGSLIYIHKAVKPARIFVNRILTLLRNMGSARRVAINRGTKRDLRWFIACANAVNETNYIHKELRLHVHITIDASLRNLGGTLGNRVYRLQIGYKPGWSILPTGRQLIFW